MSLPTISVFGNIKKIETKFLTDGKQVTKFQIECSDKDKSGKWTNLYLGAEVWDKSAEFVSKYFVEGSTAIVTGELYTNVYEKQDGSKVYENRLRFAKVQFAPKDRSGNQQAEAPQQAEPQQQTYVPPVETIPQDNSSEHQVHKNQGSLEMDENEIPF